MAKKTIHAIVEGRVQGVYFRDYTRREAERLGLVGWVRNLRDGTVEAIVSGESDQVENMITWLHQGSPRSAVTRVITSEPDQDQSFSDFSIRY